MTSSTYELYMYPAYGAECPSAALSRDYDYDYDFCVGHGGCSGCTHISPSGPGIWSLCLWSRTTTPRRKRKRDILPLEGALTRAHLRLALCFSSTPALAHTFAHPCWHFDLEWHSRSTRPFQTLIDRVRVQRLHRLRYKSDNHFPTTVIPR